MSVEPSSSDHPNVAETPTASRATRALWALMRALARGIAAHRRAVLIASIAAALGGAALASRLPIQADISYLLPPSELSVRHLRALEKRARVSAMYMFGIEADDPVRRLAAARALRTRLLAIDHDLVADVMYDTLAARRFAWDHRFLFADLTDLTAARDALKTEIAKANPLFVQIDDGPEIGPAAATPAPERDRLAELDKRMSDLDQDAHASEGMVSPDGRLQMILVRTTFSADDLARGDRLNALCERALNDTRAEVNNPATRGAGKDVTLGVTGDVTKTRAEQSGLIHGVIVATVLTVVLVVVALALFYRSFFGVAALLWSLATGSLVTFGLTKIIIGHLNIASAFLSSIVIGNGINFGLILLSRYLEERRAGHAPEDAVAAAMASTVHGTLAAALAAGVAYLSLVITPFRGFRHFGIIGGIGMALCWVSAYTVFPAALLAFERRGWLRVRGEAPVARVLAWVLPTRARPVVVGASLLAVAATAGAWHYLSHDPLETNLRNLGSDSAELDAASAWMSKFDRVFGFGISGGFVIGVPQRDDASALVARLRAVDEGKAEGDRLFSQISSLDDLLPRDQQQKLPLLAEIRRLIDRVSPRVDDQTRARLARLRPPDDLRPVSDADVPESVASPYTERDGSRGRLILANNGRGIDTWNAHDLVRFTHAVRGLGLNQDVAIGGTAFVFSDMLAAMERDGPRATMLAAVGAVVVIVLLLGVRAGAGITLFCGALGTLTLLTAAWLVGIKINFLDFIALPITIGIGIDYAANMVARGHGERAGHERADDLYRTGAAVVLCSYTTIVGYGSLLMSQNRGIRSFGLSAMLGEVTCLGTSLLVAPALLRMVRGQNPRPHTNRNI